jgi:hypothetical protein
MMKLVMRTSPSFNPSMTSVAVPSVIPNLTVTASALGFDASPASLYTVRVVTVHPERCCDRP